MPKEKTKAYYLRMPASLHKALVDQAFQQRRSLKDQIIFMLEQVLKKS